MEVPRWSDARAERSRQRFGAPQQGSPLAPHVCKLATKLGPFLFARRRGVRHCGAELALHLRGDQIATMIAKVLVLALVALPAAFSQTVAPPPVPKPKGEPHAARHHVLFPRPRRWLVHRLMLPVVNVRGAC